MVGSGLANYGTQFIKLNNLYTYDVETTACSDTWKTWRQYSTGYNDNTTALTFNDVESYGSYHTGSSASTVNIKLKYKKALNTWIDNSWNCSDSDTQTIWWSNGAAEWHVEWPKAEPINPLDRMREIISARQAPAIHTTRRTFVPMSSDVREQRARETLRRVIGEEKFRNFLRTGFVSIRARSGLVYQIWPGSGITCVYDQGTMTERLCVVLKGEFAPTDSLIMRYILILNNEKHFRSFAIRHNVIKPEAPVQPDQRNLVEIFKELKVNPNAVIPVLKKKQQKAA